MDAKTLYRQGVIAIRDQNDPGLGRELLIQALHQDPQNDMAWLWLTRTVGDRQKQLEYVERALAINPANESARQLQARLLAPSPPATEGVALPLAVMSPDQPKTVAIPVTDGEKARLVQVMERADIYLDAGDTEAAIAQWVEALTIRVDHELALRNAAGHLWRLNYRSDARELVQHAIDAGTIVPSVYLTAIDMAERLGEPQEAERLRERIASLPDADEQLLVKIADYYVERFQLDRAELFLSHALETRPDSQKLLIRLGDLQEGLGLPPQAAMGYYERAVRLGPRTKDGLEADKKLARFPSVLTDRERGSFWLAARETVGIAVLFLLLAWQDAGLTLTAMGPRRWVGVALGLFGGYLLVTATSSPQQKRIAYWLGGHVPVLQPDPIAGNQLGRVPGRAIGAPTRLPIVPEDIRYTLGIVAVALLALAFWLVFQRAIELVTEHTPPYLW